MVLEPHTRPPPAAGPSRAVNMLRRLNTSPTTSTLPTSCPPTSPPAPISAPRALSRFKIAVARKLRPSSSSVTAQATIVQPEISSVHQTTMAMRRNTIDPQVGATGQGQRAFRTIQFADEISPSKVGSTRDRSYRHSYSHSTTTSTWSNKLPIPHTRRPSIPVLCKDDIGASAATSSHSYCQGGHSIRKLQRIHQVNTARRAAAVATQGVQKQNPPKPFDYEATLKSIADLDTEFHTAAKSADRHFDQLQQLLTLARAQHNLANTDPGLNKENPTPDSTGTCSSDIPNSLSKVDKVAGTRTSTTTYHKKNRWSFASYSRQPLPAAWSSTSA